MARPSPSSPISLRENPASGARHQPLIPSPHHRSMAHVGSTLSDCSHSGKPGGGAVRGPNCPTSQLSVNLPCVLPQHRRGVRSTCPGPRAPYYPVDALPWSVLNNLTLPRSGTPGPSIRKDQVPRQAEYSTGNGGSRWCDQGAGPFPVEVVACSVPPFSSC